MDTDRHHRLGPDFGTSVGNMAYSKHRAKSCTACRQAKVHYFKVVASSQPLIDCSSNAIYQKGVLRRVADVSGAHVYVERTFLSSAFRLLTTVSRIKALEAQVERLEQSRASQSTSRSIQSGRTFDSTSQLVDNSIGLTSPHSEPHAARSNGSTNSWLALTEAAQTNFILHDSMLTYHDVMELFEHFAQFYQPHARFLGRVTSLLRLVDDSKFLLWTIIVIAARHHRIYQHQYEDIRRSHDRLCGTIFREAIQNPLDLQALLLLCTWPASVNSQWRDPSSMYVSVAISCARQMGIDKPVDEVFFGTRRATHQLGRFPSEVLKSTWLKCFELDVQMSLWHGHLPLLAATRYLKSVKDFTADPTVQIYAQTARYLLLLDEPTSIPLSWNLNTAFLEDLVAVKADSVSGWSSEHDLVYQTAAMHICMTCFVKITDGHLSSEGGIGCASSAYAKELLQSARDFAIQLITTVLGATERPLPAGHAYFEGSYPLPGYPKHESQMMYYAATVLLKYLDSEPGQQALAVNDARNAFQQAHLFFSSCPLSREHRGAGQTLEIAGRAIGSRQAHLSSQVTTRMGASIVHNVAWLGGLLRGRDRHDEYATSLQPPPDRTNEDISTTNNSLSWAARLDTADLRDDGGEPMPISDLDFPFGVWDDALYESWLKSTFEYDVNSWDQLGNWSSGTVA
ncbi:Regulatory protein leu3 [Elasticomyces elasticus]|uniref:Regulatory protein leu3 n=1 Tax=Elasticomyces elasticus TaxID=574655 RepID=A0AAN7WFR6_9PEZI|nr:Regulatory protein leu3 [Elasticomyces elasticus]